GAVCASDCRRQVLEAPGLAYACHCDSGIAGLAPSFEIASLPVPAYGRVEGIVGNSRSEERVAYWKCWKRLSQPLFASQI
ncbi:MAG: hypothetical protein ACE5HI_14935, partial [bacterium]